MKDLSRCSRPSWFELAVQRMFNGDSDVFPSDEFNNAFLGTELRTVENVFPKVNVIDNDDHVLIEAELAGLTKDEINIDVNGKLLIVSGQKKTNTEQKNVNYLRRELKHSSFKRSFVIGETLDKTNIEAKFNNGVLNIRIGKIPHNAQPNVVRKIEIK